jgi:signal transduction histidine kinase
MAIVAAVFVTRFLRAFQVEAEQKIKELQEARLKEAEQREALKGELYRRIVDAQEAERQRIARDLHDETGQALTAIGMGLRGASTALKNQHNRDQAIDTLKNLENLTANSLQELQRLIADLRPSHLDDLGLLATIRWYVNDVRERSNLEIEIITSGDEKTICAEYSTSIFRILQEALTNITKHAEATKVQIHIIFEPEEIRIAVEDDGRGFDINQIKQQKSWGLIGMEERATLLDGKFYLHSGPGKGTMVEIVIPYCPIHREDAK